MNDTENTQMPNAESSTDELISAALNETDEDAKWEHIRVLHQRGTSEVFAAASELCLSGEPLKEPLGADILGQLGTPDLPFKKESLAILLRLSKTTNDENALQSAAFALGRMEEPEAVDRLHQLKNHHSEDVRFAVVHGLLTLKDDASINALIELSDDEDEDVRNWATFGLGTQIDTDTDEIRDALLKRLDEEDSEIRGEALVGLAIRKDARVIEPLLKELSRENIGVLAVEAARDIADVRLCEPLVKIKTWWDVDEELLEEAIAACCEENRNENSDS